MGMLYFLTRIFEKDPQPSVTLPSHITEGADPHDGPAAPAAASPAPRKVAPAHSSAAGWKAHLVLLQIDLSPPVATSPHVDMSSVGSLLTTRAVAGLLLSPFLPPGRASCPQRTPLP